MANGDANDAPIEIDVRDREETPTLAIRLQPAWESLDIGALIGEAMPAVGAALGASGATPAGPPFVRYHRFGPDGVDAEVGIPVAETPSGLPPLADVPAGAVGASVLPGGLVATTLHAGPYDALGATYGRFHDAIHAAGHDDGDGPWESYLNSPDEVASPADLRTEISWPLRTSGERHG